MVDVRHEPDAPQIMRRIQGLITATYAANDGLFRRTVTMPLALTSIGKTYDDYAIETRNSANGRKLHLQTEKVTSTSFYLWCNDSTMALKVLYT